MTKNYITFRTAEFTDAFAIDQINRRCLPENYTVEHIISLIISSKNTSWVALDNDTIIGYCLTSVNFADFSALIYSFAVEEEYRRQNIGTNLLLYSITSISKLSLSEELMRVFETLGQTLPSTKIRDIYLSVRPSNKNALKLYEKLGFGLYEVKKEYYEDGEDAYMMVRKLGKNLIM